jgi:DNA-binding GntR family transcriptional regulator
MHTRSPSRTSRLSLTHDAYERLREQLLACRFPPGARLTIAELCKTFSVSQGAVREALSRLTAEGLVEARPQQGFRVMPISAADVWALTTARCDVEALCLTRSIVLGDLAWEGRILAAYHTLSRTPQAKTKDKGHYSPEFIAAHGAFLDSLVSACDNPWLARMRDMLCAQAKRYRGLSAPVTTTQRNVLKELRDVMEAALSRDASSAADKLSLHMLESAKQLIKRLDAAAGTMTKMPGPLSGAKAASRRRPLSSAR